MVGQVFISIVGLCNCTVWCGDVVWSSPLWWFRAKVGGWHPHRRGGLLTQQNLVKFWRGLSRPSFLGNFIAIIVVIFAAAGFTVW